LSEAEKSSLTEQLQRGFHGLRFEGGLEAAYRHDQFHERLRYLRINLAVLAAISLAVIQLDRVVVPVIGRIVPDLARTGVMLPLLVAGFAITFLPRADAWYPRYIAAAMTVALALMSWISVMAWGQGEPRVTMRLVLAIIAVYFVLGVAFLVCQAIEYVHAYQELNLTLHTGVYGSTFFMLTGFHGFHVTVGAIMLTVIWFRCLKGHFTPEHHFAFEGVAWYWHFVDVVWLGLFIFVYWL